MQKLRIVFMGTPDFAVQSLKKIKEANYEIAAVITSEDKQSGRGLKLNQSAVKKYAVENKLRILQPKNLKDDTFVNELKTLQANLFIVVAFRMLPEIIWQMPLFGTINLHASLLPQYRGAAPINWAIINGEKYTGVSTFFIEKQIDTGKIILHEKIEISQSDNAGDLHDKLMLLGGNLILKTLQLIENEKLKSIDQNNIINDNLDLKPAPKIFKSDCLILWNNNLEHVYNFIRGLSPYPAAWTKISNTEKSFIVKIFKVQKIETNSVLNAGVINTDGKTYIRISTNSGELEILELQIEGKKRMKTQDFLRGFRFSQFRII